MLKRCTWLVFGAALMLLIGGLPLTAAAQSGPARVRVVHAAPDTPAVDIFLDGKVVWQNVGFAAISDYMDVPAGAHKLALAPTGKDASAAILTADTTFAAGTTYTVAAIGLGNVSAKVYTDDLSAPPAGKARVRVIHFSPDAPGADVEVVGGSKLVQNLAFGEASTYLTVDAGAYNLRLVSTGANKVIVQLPNTTVVAGNVYDVMAMGRLADIQVKVATYTPAAPRGAAPAQNPGTSQAVMSNTGTSSDYLQLVMLGLLIIMMGLIIGRRFGPRRRTG